MIKFAIIIGMITVASYSSHVLGDDVDYVSPLTRYGLTITPTVHGAVYMYTPYDQHLAISMLEKMHIPPQFNGLKGYANLSDDKLPESSLFMPNSIPTSPNPLFTVTVEHYNKEKNKQKLKELLKDERL